MGKPLSDLALLLRSLDPKLHEGAWVYSSVPLGTDLSAVRYIAVIHEAEGTTVVASEDEVIKAQLPILFRAAWITLTVNSDLNAVGLTAAIATALGTAGISCNVVAGAHHDHIFVPIDRADEAVTLLRSLQRAALDN
ncbi:MAG: ACT domain-containing protein [Acidobacteriota bacterium]